MNEVRIQFETGSNEIEISSEFKSSFENDHASLAPGESFTHHLAGTFNGVRADYREYEIVLRRVR